MTISNSTFALIFFVFLCLFFYQWELGNPDILRQGTEGFYLKIASEMYDRGSFLVPYFSDEPHWSKPPLQFWLSFPISFLAGEHGLYTSRFSIVIFSILSMLLISRWAYKNLGHNQLKSFLILSGSLAFVKYSKIFMMEIPLACLTTLSVLYYYSSLEKRYSNKNFILSVGLTALSILIKGPVSLVMSAGGICLYHGIKFLLGEKIPFQRIILWGVAALFFGSLWFMACYYKFGYEFIEFFFIRENLGKFSAKSYPIASVFTGLIVYTFPWFLFIFLAFPQKLKQLSFKNENAFIFLFTNFFFFFTLWLFPNQRSHHYAVPSIPLFLILVSSQISNIASYKRPIGIAFRSIKSFLLLLFCIILTTALFINITNSFTSKAVIVFTIISIFYYAYTLFRPKSSLQILIANFIFINLIWSFITPLFILPTVPQRAIDESRPHRVTAVYRKPYFLEQILEKKVRIIDRVQMYSFIVDDLDQNGRYIVNDYVYKKHALKEVSLIVDSWPVWKRGNSFKKITNAIINRDISPLQEKMYLLKKRK